MLVPGQHDWWYLNEVGHGRSAEWAQGVALAQAQAEAHAQGVALEQARAEAHALALAQALAQAHAQPGTLLAEALTNYRCRSC